MSKPKKWKRGETGPDGMLFWSLNKSYPGGYWVCSEKFSQMMRKRLEYANEYRLANKEEIKRKSKEYRSSDESKRKLREYLANYRKRPHVQSRIKAYRDKPETKEYHRKYSSTDKCKARIKEYLASDHGKLTCQKWRSENKDKLRESKNRSYHKNSSKILAKQKRKYQTDQEYHDKKNAYANKWSRANPEKRKQTVRRDSEKRVRTVSDSYIAGILNIRVAALRYYPEILETKREQIKILRQLKQKTKQTQCTRIQATCNKSATTLLKPLIPHGSTSLLSLELSSWSTPWVRQLTQLLLKSKRQS